MNPTQSIAEHSQDSDETRLIQYIATHRAKGGEHMDFDKSFWIDAATEMASQGTPTTAHACRSKWAQICTTFYAVNKLANVPGLSYTLQHGAGVTTQSEAIWAKFIKNHPQAKPFKTKGWPHYETVQNLIPSSNLRNVSPSSTRRRNVFHDILHPTTIDLSDSGNKKHWDSVTKMLDAVEFGIPIDTINKPTPSRLLGPNHPAHRPRFDPSDFSSSESESDNIYALSVPASTSQHASFLHAFEQLGESLNRLISAFEHTPEATCSVDPIPLRKQRAIVKVQKEDLDDNDILSLIILFQADVTIADSYLAIERDGVRKLYLASYLKK